MVEGAPTIKGLNPGCGSSGLVVSPNNHNGSCSRLGSQQGLVSCASLKTPTGLVGAHTRGLAAARKTMSYRVCFYCGESTQLYQHTDLTGILFLLLLFPFENSIRLTRVKTDLLNVYHCQKTVALATQLRHSNICSESVRK